MEKGVTVWVPFAVTDGVTLDPSIREGVNEGVEINAPFNRGIAIVIPSTNSGDERQFETCNSRGVIPDNAEILSSVSSLWTV